MSFEIKQKTKVSIKIYGQEFTIVKPTVGQVEQLQKFASAGEKSQVEQFSDICDFLDILGLPKDFSKDMEIDHLVKLINYVSGELNFDKKKSEAGL